MKSTFAIILACLITISCNNQTTQAPVPETSDSITNKQAIVVIDTTYDRFKADTSLTFSDDLARRDFMQKKQREWDEYSRPKKAAEPTNLNLAYELDSVGLLIQDQLGYILFKHLRDGEKTDKNIFLITYNTEFSKLISPEERMALFNMYPEKIRNSHSGKETLKRLNKYRENHNLGRNILDAGKLILLDTSFASLPVSQAMDTKTDYTLVIFTASWCSPCRYEARFLKKNFQKVDTGKIRFVSISIDTKRNRWTNFVRTEASPWPQYLTEGEYESPLLKKIELSSLPLNLLLDKDKKVIDEDVEISRLIKRNRDAFAGFL